MFSAQLLVRTILDWFMPTLDFHTRAIVSTFLSAAILLAAGFSAAWRSDSFTAGAVSGCNGWRSCRDKRHGRGNLTHGLARSRDTRCDSRQRWVGRSVQLARDDDLAGVVLGSVGGLTCIVIKRAFPDLT